MTTPLIAALRECSLYELELIILALLPLEGFGEAELLDRRQNSQRTRYGGFEIICHRTSSFLQHTTPFLAFGFRNESVSLSVIHFR